MASYKQAQKKARDSKYNAYVIWVSCRIFSPDGMDFVKETVQGPCVKTGKRLGKAEMKRRKRLTHTKGYYGMQRVRGEEPVEKKNVDELMKYFDTHIN